MKNWKLGRRGNAVTSSSSPSSFSPSSSSFPPSSPSFSSSFFNSLLRVVLRQQLQQPGEGGFSAVVQAPGSLFSCGCEISPAVAVH